MVPTVETRTFPRSLFIDALVYADLDPDNIVERYSGRGMYGAECFGYAPRDESGTTTNHIGRLVYALGTACRDSDNEPSCTSRECGGCDQCEAPSVEEAARLMTAGVQYEQLGYGHIVYFPGWLLGDHLV